MYLPRKGCLHPDVSMSSSLSSMILTLEIGMLMEGGYYWRLVKKKGVFHEAR